MFNKEVRNMTLTNDIVDRLFDNITASGYGMDRTFAVTLRAVLHGRLPAGESLHLALAPLADYMTTAEIITERIRQHDYGHSYTIYIAYPNDKRIRPQVLESVRAYIGEGKRYLDTYAPREDLRVFYIKKLNGLFYTNSFSAIIFVDSLDLRRIHALQMMIPKYLPALFADNPLTAEEMALLKSLGNRGSDEYGRLIEQFAQRFDMRGEIIRSRLQGFETVFERERVQQVTRDIGVHRQEYQLHLDNLRRTSALIQELNLILAGLQCRIDEDGGESELMEYFPCNKQLSLIKVQGTALEFVVHGYADIYDEEAFDTYARNPNSYLYRDIGSSVTRDGMEKLYRAIFGSGMYKLRVCAAYRADIRNSITPALRRGLG